MAGPTVNVEGATTADGTEQILATVTGSKYLQFSVDTRLMVSGDIVEVRAYLMAKAAGTLSRFHIETYTGDQTIEPLSPIKDTGPFWVPHQFRLTLEQTAGTNRAYDWSIRES